MHADLESGIDFLLELGLLSLLSCLGFLLLRLKLFDGGANALLVLLRALHDLRSINSFVAQSLVKLLQVADLASDRLGSFVLLILVALLGLLHHVSIKLIDNGLGLVAVVVTCHLSKVVRFLETSDINDRGKRIGQAVDDHIFIDLCKFVTQIA